MSRITKYNDKGIEVVFGHDHACGWFVQAWDIADCYTPLLDVDEKHNNLTQEMMKAYADKYDVSITDKDLHLALVVTPRERYIDNKNV